MLNSPGSPAYADSTSERKLASPVKTGRPRKPMRLFVDQYGRVVFARTTKELREKTPGRFSMMYVDKCVDGKNVCLHVGYVVGPRWFTEYQRVERPA